MNRYDKTKGFINNSDEYEEFFDTRKNQSPEQLGTLKLNDFQEKDLSFLNYVYHTYRNGEKLYNISNRYYGNQNHGWLILLTNKISSPFGLYDGIKLKIFLPLESILGVIG